MGFGKWDSAKREDTPKSGKQLNIGIEQRILSPNIGTTAIGRFTRVGRSLLILPYNSTDQSFNIKT